LSEYGRQILVGGVAAVIVGIILIASIAYLPLVATSTISTSSSRSTISSTENTTTSTSNAYPTSAQTTNSTLGLKLILSTNAASIASGQLLNVSFSVVNILPNVNNVSKSSNWKLQQFENSTDTLYQCIGWGNLLIYRGYFSQANLTVAANDVLPLFQPGVNDNCTVFDFSLYSFQASSSYASVYYSGGGPVTSSYGTWELTSSGSIAGYYTPNQSYYILNKFVSPSPFLKGTYTIVVGDEWGQIVILHFTVTETSNQTTREPISFVQGSTSICTASCNYPSPYLSSEVLVNSTSPLRSLQLYINGTYEGASLYSNNFTTAYVIEYKSNPTNQTLPIVSGKAYEITLIATFQDNSTSSASTRIIAGSGPGQSSTDLVCVTTNYQVLGIESITVQNGTTTTLPVRTTTTSTVESTVTTTTNVTETVSYVTTTTSYSPPSSWTVVVCTYVKG
jgi:hypothetical protein